MCRAFVVARVSCAGRAKERPASCDHPPGGRKFLRAKTGPRPQPRQIFSPAIKNSGIAIKARRKMARNRCFPPLHAADAYAQALRPHRPRTSTL
jgi:hypothetical protein